MAPMHVAITVGIALCAFGALGGLRGLAPGEVVGLSIYAGYILAVLTVIVALINLILLAFRVFSGTGRDLFRRSWLGFVNVGLVVAMLLAIDSHIMGQM
ncbi:MAG: hypothetical protein ACREMY_08550 [bacterium]